MSFQNLWEIGWTDLSLLPQPVTKYLRLTLVAHYGKCLVSVFQEFFASVKKVFDLAGWLGTSASFYGL